MAAVSSDYSSVSSSVAPAYLALLRSGVLQERVRAACAAMRDCTLCPRQCRVDRTSQVGSCHTGLRARVASYGPHLGEEDPLRGSRGSGTIFFSWCNLRCRYCQNHDISQGEEKEEGNGSEVEPEQLAAMMLDLQARGCHNVNLVSPSHVVAPILAAVLLAAQAGLRLPLVYNTGGYDALQTLQLLDGVVDIYMPDMKYADAAVAERYSGVRDYPAVNQAAVREMHRQVGNLCLDAQGVAQRGLLVRHLVLPGGLAGTAAVAEFLACEISLETYINVMDQYRPCYQAHSLPPLNRRPTAAELQQAREAVLGAGLQRLDRRVSGWALFGGED